MMTLHHVWWLAALILGAASVLDLRARRWGNATFWGLLAVVFAAGDSVLAAHKSGNLLPAQCVGVGVIVLGLLAGLGGMRRAATPADGTDTPATTRLPLGHRLFGPALLIPAVTAVLVVAAPRLNIGGQALIARESPTLIALAIGCVVAVIAALQVTRARPPQALVESSRLLDSLSWAVVLPMLLAALGAVFATTGVGDAIASLVGMAIPTHSALACTIAYGLGMILFTVIMGNAFAAFPVMTGGIALPLLIRQHGADPAIVGALGMLTGYCGTLLTPMAANFNIVPAVLLELKDNYGVIRMQIPTALVLACVNITLMYLLAFR